MIVPRKIKARQLECPVGNTVVIKTRLNVWLGSDCKIKYGLITLIEYKIGIKRNKIQRWKLKKNFRFYLPRDGH